ncbi:SCFD1 [Cordylochernes scorpioides]|uniref:SCFD1 n=1 Tax=Cordylochernes scorpioides TaxID=51811 RepID=A0ABY6JUQ3_9ARAC|nr:SCFD1 [Cordylochernes scorpioides]
MIIMQFDFALTNVPEPPALRQVLNLSNPPSVKNAEPVWKVLIYDQCGQDIISPLLSVKDLRELGITLHLLITAERDPVPDVAAVYLVQPTEENVRLIARDMELHLYDSLYLNFISPVSRQRLEDLAKAAILSDSTHYVKKVYDQYLNFITLEEDLFMLKHHDQESLSYYALNRGVVKDTEMEEIIDSIVDSLFSVLVTLDLKTQGTVPIIRSPPGNAAEMVAEKLDKKLRENLRDSRSSLFTSDSLHSGQFSFQRPLLVILDRNVDLATPLHHTWTYQALSHDVLDLRLNRITLSPRIYDLNPADKFWVQHKGSPFPLVAEAVQEELESYRSSEEEVKRLRSSMGLDGDNADEAVALVSDSTNKLTSAVSSLPELLEKKRLIDLHTTLATAVLDQIKARKLDVFFEVEEKILSKTTLDKSLMDMLVDPKAGTPADKMRLFLIYFLCGPNMSDSEVDSYLAAISEECKQYLPSIHYLRRWKSYCKMALSSNQYQGGGTRTVNMFSKLMSHGSQFVMEGVKNLVIKKHNLPITRIVDALMELKSLQEVEDYRYLDPKVFHRGTDMSRTPFQDALVFVVGGGNYIEYQNLADYSKGKQIVYGCTHLMTAIDFLNQIIKHLSLTPQDVSVQ